MGFDASMGGYMIEYDHTGHLDIGVVGEGVRNRYD